MKILFIVLTALFLFALAAFMIMNLDVPPLPISLFGTDYPEVGLHTVVIWWAVIGVLYAGIIGVAQGLQVRTANRQLNREVQRLESELNQLRTQPSLPRPDPELLEEVTASSVAREPLPLSNDPPSLPSAPVYSSDDDDDPDDDFYTGGRAV